ncbi:bifunctional precorrin-2 dehydrogenase/sirohydrochlorin ferrochelatase [Iamia majanohamensis]|uniref:precorrin-2 dehydrogenase n=1 Tax=Iamia majanohamensis TaxID=467976 RepID=A0AAE9Y5B0_9ACTN|nr:bifunctional precorrin-2 dehydrogenase/sirohydrochlorin ferrochelatase [Iamia majanohamensis]WCO66754.1 bifunctional precorrin-2 dehydrogenase/sirohydrochlorin ferrochelatase [Iamia majanohamensis]
MAADAPSPSPAGTGRLYPVGLRLEGRSVLVVGGGAVAAQKVRELVACGAEVTVVAPAIVDELADDARVTCHRRPYRSGEAADHRFVVAATDRREVNQEVHDDAEAAGVWVNAADDPQRCSVTLPARVRRGSLLVTISTEGRSPALATWLRRRLEDELGPEVEVLLEVLAEERDRIRAAGGSTEGLDWQGALGSGMLDEIRAGRIDAAKELLKACLSSSSA